MSINMRRQLAGSVPTPDGNHDQIFIDENGNPSKKDPSGAVSALVSVDGTPLAVDKQTSDPTVIAGQRGQLYTKLVSGVIELFFRDDLGQVIQITNNGNVNGGVEGGRLFTPRWSDFGAKTGVAGEYWENSEVCNANYGDSLMVNLDTLTDILTVNLPVMTADDAGKQIQVISVFDDVANPGGYGDYYYYQYYGRSGHVLLVPQAGDAILDATGTGPNAGEQKMNYFYGPEYALHQGPWSSTLMADGNGRWVVAAASRGFTNRASFEYTGP